MKILALMILAIPIEVVAANQGKVIKTLVAMDKIRLMVQLEGEKEAKAIMGRAIRMAMEIKKVKARTKMGMKAVLVLAKIKALTMVLVMGMRVRMAKVKAKMIMEQKAKKARVGKKMAVAQKAEKRAVLKVTGIQVAMAKAKRAMGKVMEIMTANLTTKESLVVGVTEIVKTRRMAMVMAEKIKKILKTGNSNQILFIDAKAYYFLTAL